LVLCSLAFLAGAVQKEMPDWRRVQVNLGQAATPAKLSTAH
jgi:hypothetical protein